MADIELHAHPFLGKNSIENTLKDVLTAMGDRSIDVLGIESLDDSIFPHVVEETKKQFDSVTWDESGIRFSNGKYILNGREYNTQENIHVLTIGYSMNDATPDTEIRRVIDNGLENEALVVLDHPFVDNGKTKTAGHISESLEEELEGLCKEYSGEIALEWNAYCIPWMRQVLKYGLNLFNQNIRYHDVNQRVEEFSSFLQEEGYNVPVVADTDLHARRKNHLNSIGTSRIISDVKGEYPKEIVSSMHENIFNGNHTNYQENVSAIHLLRTFCLPVLFPKYFDRPRG